MIDYQPQSSRNRVVTVVILLAIVGGIIAMTRIKQDREQQQSPIFADGSGSLDHQLGRAIAADDYDQITALLKGNPQPKVRPDILESIALDNRVNALRAFLDAGIDPNGPNKDGGPLARAITQNQVKAVQLLLERHANPNLPNRAGIRPLPIACSIPRTDNAIVEALLASGADANLPSVEMNTTGQPTDVTPHLQARGFPRGSGSGTEDAPKLIKVETYPLDGAIFSGRVDWANLLLQHGAKFQPHRYVRQLIVWSASRAAANAGGSNTCSEMAMFLVAHGVDVNGMGYLSDPVVSNGNAPVTGTPLIAAAQVGNTATVRYLMSRGADPKRKASDGRTAADAAATEEIRTLLASG